MPRIEDFPPGTAVVYWFEHDQQAHAVVASQCYGETEDNAHPRLTLAVLYPRSARWSNRFAVQHLQNGDDEKQGKWQELSEAQTWQVPQTY